MPPAPPFLQPPGGPSPGGMPSLGGMGGLNAQQVGAAAPQALPLSCFYILATGLLKVVEVAAEALLLAKPMRVAPLHPAQY